MTNVNFLYEFKTPLGYLPIGYELKDLPIIFNELNETTEDRYNHVVRCCKGSGMFRVLSETMDVFYYFEEMAQDTDYKFSKVLVKDLSSEQLKNDLNLFVITPNHDEPITYQIESMDFDDILTQTSLDLLKKYRNVKLVFEDNKEGAMTYSDKFFENIYNFVTKHQLKSNKVSFITNTSNINDIYQIYLKKYNLESFMTCQSIDFFVVQDTGTNIIHYERATHNYKLDKITERGDDYSLDPFPHLDKREKYFLCLNRNSERLHRPRLVLDLIRYNLFDKGKVSLHKSEALDKFCDKPQNIHYKRYICDKYPFTIDYEDPHHIADLHNFFSGTEMWNDTYFSIVNETSVATGSIFITEKTIKPMIYFHPFIVYGSPGILQEVKNLGFETFPEFFDESYDLIEDETERLKAIMKNVEKVCSLTLDELHELYHSVYSKLLHNRKILINFIKDNYALTKFMDTISL